MTKRWLRLALLTLVARLSEARSNGARILSSRVDHVDRNREDGSPMVVHRVVGEVDTLELGSWESGGNGVRGASTAHSSGFLSAHSGVARRNLQGPESEPVCRVVLNDIMYQPDILDHEVHSEEFFGCHPIVDGSESGLMFKIELTDELAQSCRDDISMGKDVYVAVPNGSLSMGDVIVPSKEAIRRVDAPELRRRKLQKTPTEGVLSVFVLRISASDNEPDFSAEELFSLTFEDEISPKTQLDKCSWGKLTIEPSTYGMLDVRLNIPSEGAEYVPLMNGAEQAANSYFGVNVRDEVDLIMFILPPGTGSWAAFATVGGKQSVYNNAWGGYLGGTMHELGHNLGLRHSFEMGVEYEGRDGYMGSAPQRTRYPQRCYNGQNHWFLGWYQDRSLEVDPFRSRVVKLAAFVDYMKAATDEPVVVKIGYDLYLQYNRAKGMNQDTNDAEDAVSVVRDLGDGTDLIASLDTRNSVFREQDGNEMLTVEVCGVHAGNALSPDYMLVAIGYQDGLCPTVDTEPPTKAPTKSPTRAPTVVFPPGYSGPTAVTNGWPGAEAPIPLPTRAPTRYPTPSPTRAPIQRQWIPITQSPVDPTDGSIDSDFPEVGGNVWNIPSQGFGQTSVVDFTDYFPQTAEESVGESSGFSVFNPPDVSNTGGFANPFGSSGDDETSGGSDNGGAVASTAPKDVSDKNNGGAIAGSVLAVLFVIAVAVALIVLHRSGSLPNLWKRRDGLYFVFSDKDGGMEVEAIPSFKTGSSTDTSLVGSSSGDTVDGSFEFESTPPRIPMYSRTRTLNEEPVEHVALTRSREWEVPSHDPPGYYRPRRIGDERSLLHQQPLNPTGRQEYVDDLSWDAGSLMRVSGLMILKPDNHELPFDER